MWPSMTLQTQPEVMPHFTFLTCLRMSFIRLLAKYSTKNEVVLRISYYKTENKAFPWTQKQFSFYQEASYGHSFRQCSPRPQLLRRWREMREVPCSLDRCVRTCSKWQEALLLRQPYVCQKVCQKAFQSSSLRRCGIYTQWTTTQPKKKKNRCKLLHLNG